MQVQEECEWKKVIPLKINLGKEHSDVGTIWAGTRALLLVGIGIAVPVTNVS